jgi:peptide subunit release factor 1 (eRF1)
MEPKQMMENSIKVLLHDVDRIDTLIGSVQEELRSLEQISRVESKVSVMKEQLGEAHARLEGVRDFIIACGRRVNRKAVEEEGIDVWL